MQVLKGPGFHIVYMPKMGTTSLTQWASNEEDLTRLQLANSVDWIKVAPNDPIYASWRPPLERVISGVYQGLLLLSLAAQEPIEKHVAEWLRNPSLLGRAQISRHTELFKNAYGKYDYQSWNWFHLSQLGSLHTYLNNKHGTSLEKAPKLNSHGSQQELFYGEDWQNKNPKIMKLLREYVANEYIPENFLDL